MSDQENKENKTYSKRDKWLILSWSKIRKFEALVFLFMFFAVPWFGLRVVSYTKSQMVLNNITFNLVEDLHATKEKAVQTKQKITLKAVRPKVLTFSKATSDAPFRYVIIHGIKVDEEVVLPSGISISGIVTFLEDGRPEKPSSFVLSKGKRTSTIEIDKKGLVSVP